MRVKNNSARSFRWPLLVVLIWADLINALDMYMRYFVKYARYLFVSSFKGNVMLYDLKLQMC